MKKPDNAIRKAVASDFKVGTVFMDIHENWEFTILNKYDEGIWEARFKNGDACVFGN